jgi:hypothetical protein
MTKLGKRLIQAAREANAIARNDADPQTYRVHDLGEFAPYDSAQFLKTEFRVRSCVNRF